MSQEKVDRYKEAKANRKELMKKEKRNRTLRNAVAGIVVAALVGWIGYSAYQSFVVNKTAEEAVVDYTSMDDYLREMSKTE